MPWSARIHTEFHVYGATQGTPRARRVFSYGAITLFGGTFQFLLLTVRVSHRGPTTPTGQVLSVWAVPLSLATTDGIDSRSFPAVTEMFHFAAYRSTGPMNSDQRDTV